MIGGLLTSTVFTLLALPTFYSFVHHRRERRRAITGVGAASQLPADEAERE